MEYPLQGLIKRAMALHNEVMKEIGVSI